MIDTGRRKGLTAGLAMALGASTWHRTARAGAYEEFFRALEVDNVGALVSLLQRGFDPNTPDSRGLHPLFLALRGESAKSFDALMQHPGIQVDVPNARGESPLMMAALRGNLPAMQALVARGAQINREGWTPLHYAASAPSAEAVRWLIGKGALLDSRAPNGSTPLMLAARYGQEESVWLLVDSGADRGLREARGLTAVDLARGEGRESLARQLAQGQR